MPRASSFGGDVRGRLDAEDGDAERDEMLQEIPVVARDLDHQALGTSARAGSIIASAYRFACATHESEYEEKYA